jgi:putative DNA primase/helicase
MHECETRFLSAIVDAGLQPPSEVIGDGKLHRFASSGRRGDDSGWYVLHLDGAVSAGVFGDWRTGLQNNWCAREENTLTASERRAFRERITQVKTQREADEAQRQSNARQHARELLRDSMPVTNHPYLTKKGIHATQGVKTDGPHLLIPLRDAEGALHSLQMVDTEGHKRFLPGGRVKGCYFALGQLRDVLIVCEGFATGASLYEATGQAVAVAFNAGNLLAVARSM